MGPAQKPAPGRRDQPKPCDQCGAPVGFVGKRGALRRSCDPCTEDRRRVLSRARDKKRGWRRPNPEKQRARKRRYVLRNQGRLNAQSLERYYADVQRRRSAARTWKRANAERVAAGFKAWAASNRARINLTTHKRRSLVAASPGVTLVEWQAIHETFAGRCAYCLRPATEIEHVIAIADGGLHEPANVVPACRSCNASKGKKKLVVWLMDGGAQ